MLVRLGIAAVILVVGLMAYHLGTRWQVSRAARKASANGDDLLSQMRPGVPGIIYFWSPDCAPCLSVQKPALEALNAELGEGGLQVLPVNVYDDPDAAAQWGVLSLPTTFIVDVTGTPRAINNGVARLDKLRRQIAEFA